MHFKTCIYFNKFNKYEHVRRYLLSAAGNLKPYLLQLQPFHWLRSIQEPKVPHQPSQSKQTFETPLTWTYPEDPRPEPQPEVPFELRYPVPAVTVAVECREKDAHVEVKKDMFGIGQLINAADLTLGTCGAVGEDNAAQVLIYEAELQDCGSTLMMTEEALIYSFMLNYNPQPVGSVPVVRTSSAAVIVECHYPRCHNVSSLPLDPLWIPFSATKVAEELLYFTLKLMTDDWQYERPVNQYFLGDMINIEAVVKQYFHVPLRVYVDSCVATLSHDINSNPRYKFIENYGCLVDAKITGSASKFMPRTAENKLQFQLEAFRFQGANSGMVRIFNTLFTFSAQHTANTTSARTIWKEASGADGACGSCDSGAYGSSGSVAAEIGASSSTGVWPGFGSGTGTGTGISLSNPGRKSRDVSQVQTQVQNEGTLNHLKSEFSIHRWKLKLHGCRTTA
uniref:Zona pellucida sperm-binding protein 3 n=1 Tax=Myripristis murdjan TaxID=586833 RepID=A0A667X0I2_9TELE